MTAKDRIINAIIQTEGGYVNDPKDSGGETMFGITVAIARANGYEGDMKELPRSLAYQIYAAQYWDVNNLDQVAALNADVAEEIADTGVNCGPRLAAIFFQRCLNALNRQQKMYPDVKLDGKLGPVSIAALKAFLAADGVVGAGILLNMLNSLQGAHYIALAETRQKDEAFIRGWFKNRIKIKAA